MMLLSALFAVATATTPNCPVTCEQVQVNGTRVNHTADSTDPYNYATSLTHSTIDDNSYRIKVTHNVYNANTGSYKHHRCYKTTNMAVDITQRCVCECITSSNNNNNKFPTYPDATITPYNPWGTHDDVKTGNVNNNKDLATFWSDRTSAQAATANTNV
jgi:hypothetical protein